MTGPDDAVCSGHDYQAEPLADVVARPGALPSSRGVGDGFQRRPDRGLSVGHHGAVAQFPSMKARELLAVLQREPLGYEIVKQNGSHRQLRAEGRNPLTFAFHDGVTVAPGLVRKILVKDVGLDQDEALGLL